VKGRAGKKGPRSGRNKRKVWVRLVKKELQKHIELVSAYQITAPSGTSVGMTFVEDTGLALRWYLFIIVYSE